MADSKKESSAPPAPRVIREPLGGCRRIAIILGVIALGVILLLVGLTLGMPSEPESEPPPPPARIAGLPVVTIYSDPSCQCCSRWIQHLQSVGFPVQVVSDTDMAKRKDALGIPKAKRSCHTATVGGYIVEGHVPAEDIVRMLKNHQAIKGLVLPGMPVGSPGMEPKFGVGQDYTVEALQPDGSTRVFTVHRRR